MSGIPLESATPTTTTTANVRMLLGLLGRVESVTAGPTLIQQWVDVVFDLKYGYEIDTTHGRVILVQSKVNNMYLFDHTGNHGCRVLFGRKCDESNLQWVIDELGKHDDPLAYEETYSDGREYFCRSWSLADHNPIN